MTLPILADFAIRLGGGLAGVLAATPWRAVPPRFFRTHCQIILGLATLASLVAARPPADPWAFGLAVASAALAFVATLAWGLGLPRVGVPASAAIAGVSGVALAASATGALDAASRLASSFLLGATLTAMLLGHYYLTAPAMSIEPLKRFVRFMAVGLALRAALAGAALVVLFGGESSGVPVPTLFLAIRWGMGIVGVGLATALTWKTVQIRSTQSATGILYIAMTLLLFGELSSLILSRDLRLTP